MILLPRRSVSPRTSLAAGFTILEVTLALAIVATAFVGIIGLLPAGLDASRRAVDSTVVAAVLESVQNRLPGEKLVPGPASFSPAYFDMQGEYLPPGDDAEVQKRRFYRADVTIGNWTSRPANTSALRPVTVALSWPVTPATGEAVGKDNPRTTITYPATALTGPDWKAIEPTYAQKIEF